MASSELPDEPSEEEEDWYEECAWCGQMVGRYEDHECDEDVGI